LKKLFKLMTRTQKQVWITLVVVASLAIGSFLGHKFFLKSFIEKKYLAFNAKEYNKKCPITYSNGVRMDSVAVQSDSSLNITAP
jgi:hypothetical protein